MLLSIIIPVFNGEKKISRCLESLRVLEEKKIEFIIINDGSTDNTKNICEQYAKEDGRFLLFNQVNGGAGKARNLGISCAKGKYIGFVDADDELTFEYNDVIEVIKKIESNFFAFDHYVETKENTEVRCRELFLVGENTRDVLIESFLTGILSCVWNNVYLTKIIKDYNISFPEDMCMGEDLEFNARYIRHCNNSYYINKKGYKYYFDNNENATNKRHLNYLNDFVKIYERFLNEKDYYKSSVATFYFPYYIDKVYEILKIHRKKLSDEDKKKFKSSDFYKDLLRYNYRSRTHSIKRCIIYLYTSF